MSFLTTQAAELHTNSSPSLSAYKTADFEEPMRGLDGSLRVRFDLAHEAPGAAKLLDAPRVLIADDQPDVLTALRLLLKNAGFRAQSASSPGEIITAVQRSRFDLLLIDLNYTRDTTSGREGLDVLSELQLMENTPPVVVMTAWGSIELAVEAMRRGACDFALKPWDNDHLVNILREHTAKRFNPSDRAFRGTGTLPQRHDDVNIARQVQRRLFPQQAPELRTLQYAAHCRQAGAVGGDYYDFLDLGCGQVGFVFVDVSGKGMPAALLMANLQATLRSQASQAARDLPAFISSVNRLFHGSTRPEHYATLFFAIYDDRTRALRYVNCGHTPPLLLRAGGGVERLAATATVVGLFEQLASEVGEMELGRGDLWVAYSDGVTEARGREGGDLGEEGLVQLLQAHRGEDISSLPLKLTGSVREFSAYGQEDDLTALVARGI